MTLRVGSQLYYWPAAIHGKQPSAAIVTSVRREGVVDVTVFQANGRTMGVEDVPVLGIGDTATGPHCTWPNQDQTTEVANAARAGFTDRGES